MRPTFLLKNYVVISGYTTSIIFPYTLCTSHVTNPAEVALKHISIITMYCYISLGAAGDYRQAVTIL